MTLSTALRALLFAAVSVSLHAASPVGWATAPGTVRISKTAIPANAGPSPVAVGDLIVAIEAPVLIMLEAGGRIVLQQHSKLRLDQDDAELQLRLESGGLSFQLPAGSQAAIYSGSRRISDSSTTTGVASAATDPEQTGGALPPRSREGVIPSDAQGFRPPSPSQPCSGDVQARPPRSDCQ